MDPGSKSLVDLESQGTDRSIVREEEEEMGEIFFYLERGDWNSMLEFLKQHGSRSTILHPVKTEFKDTIVHAAAALGQKDVVKELLVRIKEMNLETSLGVLLANQLANNPLHSAALMGQVDTVRVIFDEVPDLASARNIYGETPIFQAAVSGSIQVFSELATKLPPGINDIITMLRRNDGDTILHCALSGEYFGIKVPTESNSDASREIKLDNGHRELAGDHKLNSTVAKFWQKTFTALARRPRPKGDQTSGHRPSAKQRFFKFIYAVFVLILISPILALLLILTLELYVIVISVWPVIQAVEGFISRRATIQKLKKKQWQDFSEINSGMDPYRYQVEWARGNQLGKELQGDETPAALLQEKEIPSAFETNFIQKSKQIASTASHPSDPTSSSLPPTSFMSSSTNGASFDRTREPPKRGVIESPFLIAGRKGMIEMVGAILDSFPMAIHDKDLEHKNIMLLAAEHRQHKVYEKFLGNTFQSWFGQADAEGNSLLHLAAKYPDNQGQLISGAIPGAALQMQREIAWFNFVEKQLPPYFSTLQNHYDQTAMEVFTETHQDLAMQRAKWLSKASQSCSVVATLIISVVFATMSTVPGGLIQEQQDRGLPVYRDRLAFNVFSVSSLSALCFSSISLIMFLKILTSPYQDSDISNKLANKLIFGLAFLFISIIAMFLSFFSGDLFVLDSKMKHIAYPIYVLTLCVVLAGFPLYSEIVKMVVTGIPTSTRPRKIPF